MAQDSAVQVRPEFHFTADLPYASAAPLFGSLAEQKWAPEWKPQFLFPNPPVDQEGAVFRVDYPGHSSVWVASVFDLPGGHVQYVNVLNNLVLTRIDIRLAADGAKKTAVSVVYERTALDPKANEHVRSMAAGDAKHSNEWETAINAYAAKLKTPSQ